MIDRNILHSVETETSNPIVFVGLAYPKMGKELQNKFHNAMYLGFKQISHPGLKKIVLYDPILMVKLGTYNENGFKPNK